MKNLRAMTAIIDFSMHAFLNPIVKAHLTNKRRPYPYVELK